MKDKFWQLVKKYKNFFHIAFGVLFLWVAHTLVYNLFEINSNDWMSIFPVAILSYVFAWIGEGLQQIFKKGTANWKGALKTFIPTIIYIIGYLTS